jgi:predicted nucleic acid-binding protein
VTSAPRTFVDTNVLVYAFDEADPAKRAAAQAVLDARSTAIVISAQVLSEFYVVVTRRLERPLAPALAAAAVEQLSRLPVVPFDAALVREAIAISQDAPFSFWDGLIVAAATASGCEVLLTEDLAAGSTIGSLRIESPFPGMRPARHEEQP